MKRLACVLIAIPLVVGLVGVTGCEEGTVAPPPEPADFSVSNLSIQPTKVKSGETVTATVEVTNTGGTTGDYIIALKIDGIQEAEEVITIAPSSSQTIKFHITMYEAGTHAVAVDGLTDNVTVSKPPELNG